MIKALSRRSKRLVLSTLVLFVASPVLAQSTLSPQGDWNGSYGFASNADRNFRLLQSDLIKKNEEGYYESVGKITVTNNTNSIVSNSLSEVTNNDIGQQQTTIGVVSNATNNIELRNSAGATVDTRNIAESAGCIDSTIHIDSTAAGGASNGCD